MEINNEPGRADGEGVAASSTSDFIFATAGISTVESSLHSYRYCTVAVALWFHHRSFGCRRGMLLCRYEYRYGTGTGMLCCVILCLDFVGAWSFRLSVFGCGHPECRTVVILHHPICFHFNILICVDDSHRPLFLFTNLRHIPPNIPSEMYVLLL
jgi:hypothetical protein